MHITKFNAFIFQLLSSFNQNKAVTNSNKKKTPLISTRLHGKAMNLNTWFTDLQALKATSKLTTQRTGKVVCGEPFQAFRFQNTRHSDQSVSKKSE